MQDVGTSAKAAPRDTGHSCPPPPEAQQHVELGSEHRDRELPLTWDTPHLSFQTWSKHIKQAVVGETHFLCPHWATSLFPNSVQWGLPFIFPQSRGRRTLGPLHRGSAGSSLRPSGFAVSLLGPPAPWRGLGTPPNMSLKKCTSFVSLF